ncbi:MAG TPA: PEGA domain-containing protein [Bryobacteraceae bacterium]
MKRFAMILALVGIAQAEVVIPEGTPIRVRLDNRLTSATAQRDQMIDFVVVDEVRVGNTVVIESGARATGTIIISESKKHVGRGGKLDFTVDKVRGVDGRLMSVRPTEHAISGSSSTVKTGLITAGVAFVFWPAAPFILLHKGKEAEIPRGSVYTVYTDVVHAVQVPGDVVNGSAPVPAPPPPVQAVVPEKTIPSSTIQIEADWPTAEIEVDGKFVGNTPATVSMSPGIHSLTVRKGQITWSREVDLPPGMSALIQAQLAPGSPQIAHSGLKTK